MAPRVHVAPWRTASLGHTYLGVIANSKVQGVVKRTVPPGANKDLFLASLMFYPECSSNLITILFIKSSGQDDQARLKLRQCQSPVKMRAELTSPSPF
jgi:hypothetical protein